MNSLINQVKEIFKKIKDTEIHKDIVDLEMLKDANVDDNGGS